MRIVANKKEKEENLYHINWDNDPATEVLRWLAWDVYQRKIEANEEWQKKKDDFTSGRDLAYYEVWDMLTVRAESLGVDLGIHPDGETYSKDDDKGDE